jgi:hypothetical protein
VVETDDMDTATWYTAACDLLKVFVENGALGVAEEMQVEIRSPTEVNCDKRWALSNDPPLLRKPLTESPMPWRPL